MADNLIKVLESFSFKTVSGYKDVIKAIKDVSDTNTKPLCSNYGVFPDGRRCDGCSDCEKSRKGN